MNPPTADADPSPGEGTDLLHHGDAAGADANGDAAADIEIPSDTPLIITDTAAIIMETAALTSSSARDNIGTSDDNIIDSAEDDVEAESEPPTPVKVQPTIATISAIVNEVRRQKISGGDDDIASIASREVDRIFDGGTARQGEVRVEPSEQESYSLYNRKVKGGNEWNGSKYSADANSEVIYSNSRPFTANTFQQSATNQTAGGDTIMDDFAEICEELGIKDMSHPQLLRTTRRRYPILPGSALLRSTMCHYCMIITCLAGIALIIASAVTKGFDHVKKRNHALHPTWVKTEETKKREGKAWWVEDNNGEAAEEDQDSLIIGSTTPDNSKRLSPDELEQFSYALSDAYLPMWFDETTGWQGASYDDAVAFCKSHYNFVPCPYEVYCPGHGGQLIFNEVFDDNISSWAPVKDSWNEWVQVGSIGTQCTIYSETFHQTPDFGSMNAADTKAFSSQIMCCLDQPLEDATFANNSPNVIVDETNSSSGASGTATSVSSHAGAGNSSPPSDTLSAMAKFLNPIWYSTNVGGWPGGSYDDAIQFCVEKGHTLCSRTVVCPMGPTFPAIEGAWVAGADKSSEQWVPVIDQPNHWLMIGSLDTNESRLCMDYETLNGSEPAWGVDRSEPGLKRHICCTDSTVSADSQVVQGGASTTIAQSPVSKQTNFDDEVDETDTGPITSTWFRVGDGGGWNAGSHDDAVHFCAMKKINGKRMELCPYHAYCPSGPSQPPYEDNYMVNDGDETEQWAPMSTGENNSWVLVGMHGHNKASQCLTYGILKGSEPSWGLDGTNKEKKLHVLCCAKLS